MKKVLILGATGMLGSAVYGVLKDKYSLILTARNKDKIPLLEKSFGPVGSSKVIDFDVEKIYDDYIAKKGGPGEYLTKFLNEVGEVDYVINALGVTIPFSLKNPTMTLFVNGAFPHIMANIFGEKMIHITTDCAFDGKQGFPYNENSLKNPTDIYGLSKSIGEPTNCLTLRTSIIGKELDGFTGFLDWFLQQEGKDITGFGEHYWNGITTKQFAKICDQIMSNGDNYPKTGLYHVFSTTVSKYEMLNIFKEKFKINCNIKEDHENKLNRTLSTVHDLNTKLKIPSFNQMINEL